MKDGFCSIPEELLDVPSPKFDTQRHQGKVETKFELGDLDLSFKVTEVILR